MDLISLKYFYEVSQDLHITNAAKRLYISQQRLSGHIQRLEAAYGVKLIERDPKPHLTAAGRYLASYAEQMLNMERDLHSNLLDISKEQSGILRIGISQLRSAICFPDIMIAFHEKYPAVKLVVSNGRTAQFYDQLQADKLDMFIGVGNTSYDNLNVTNLMVEKTYMLVSDSILAEVYGSPLETVKSRLSAGVRIEDFRMQPFILPSSNNRLHRIVSNIFVSADIQPKIICETDSNQLQTILSARGLGISFLPQMMAKQLIGSNFFWSSPTLNLFPMDYPQAQYRIFLAHPIYHHIPRYISCFRDITVQVFSHYSNMDCTALNHANVYDTFFDS